MTKHLFEYIVIDKKNGPEAEGMVIGQVTDELGHVVIAEKRGRPGSYSIGSRPVGKGRYIGHAVFESLPITNPRDYKIEDAYGEPREWMLTEWLDTIAQTVSGGRLEHE